jgi:hypothetical protein
MMFEKRLSHKTNDHFLIGLVFVKRAMTVSLAELVSTTSYYRKGSAASLA